MPEQQSLSDALRQLIPEPTEDITAALEMVAQLEHEHAATVEQARIERAFLLRAPREGLLYPGDALKLEDVVPKLREAGENDEAMEDLFIALRSSRPYLFSKPPASPANQKLSEPDAAQLRGKLRHGSLTRQVQEIRRRKRP